MREFYFNINFKSQGRACSELKIPRLTDQKTQNVYALWSQSRIKLGITFVSRKPLLHSMDSFPGKMKFCAIEKFWLAE